MGGHNHKRLKIAHIIATIAVIGFGALFVYNLADYFFYLRDNRITRQNTAAVQEIFVQFIDEILVDIGEEIMPSPSQNQDLLNRARQLTHNTNIIAYIAIPGTNIGNVVVQYSNNEHFLHHDIFGNPNVNGSLFMDFRNTPNFTDQNTIIFGHNMRGGTMFHNLRYYVTQPNFAARHPQIFVATDGQILIYEVFAAFSTNIDFDYIQVHFTEAQPFNALLDEINRRNTLSTRITITEDDNILILSTCTNTHQDTRYVVVARLI